MHVFIPYQSGEGGAQSPYYDTAEFRAELDEWFVPARPWVWRAVTLDPDSVSQAVGQARQAGAVVLNLCDGDELDGYPGPTVVAALEAAGLGYTGADPLFYALSSSKLAMKRRFMAALVPTAHFIELDEEGRIAEVAAAVGYPCVLKLDVSADGIGMTRHSVAADAAQLVSEWRRVRQSGLGSRRPYAERFIAGREMSVLVIEDETCQDRLRALAPVECVFNDDIPGAERILFKGHRDYDPQGRRREPGSAARVDYRVAPATYHDPLCRLAKQAFRAVDGRGYARIDIRIDAARDAAFVLEVNANCSLSRDELSIAPALAQAGWAFADLVALMLAKAEAGAR